MESCEKDIHVWAVVLELELFPNGKGGYYKYHGKCRKCGLRLELDDEMLQYIFSHGGLRREDD